MENTEIFHCEKLHCDLSEQACIERRKAFKESRGRYIPTHPECQECMKVFRHKKEKIYTGENRDNSLSALSNAQLAQSASTIGGKKMFHKKIDDGKLREMISAGKFIDEMAKTFQVGKTAIGARCKKLGLVPNLRRKKHGTVAKSDRPASPLLSIESSRPIPFFTELKESSGQVIPVTLRIMVEIDVMVNRG